VGQIGCKLAQNRKHKNFKKNASEEQKKHGGRFPTIYTFVSKVYTSLKYVSTLAVIFTRTCSEEIRHAGALLFGFGGELPVPGLDPVLLHGHGSLHLYMIGFKISNKIKGRLNAVRIDGSKENRLLNR
jgi:hypothetical protein